MLAGLLDVTFHGRINALLHSKILNILYANLETTIPAKDPAQVSRSNCGYDTCRMNWNRQASDARLICELVSGSGSQNRGK